MKRKKFSFIAVVFLGLLMSVFGFGQNERNASAVGDLYVISAKAGGVNFTQGEVAITRNDSRSGYLLKGDRLEIGEKVSTGKSGRAEILLNPGSFVRLGADTEFQFISTSLDNLKIKLTRGSAVFELIADDEFAVSIETPKGGFNAVESGVYRVDVLNDGSGKIFVYNGKAKINDATAAVVKKGKTATINGTNVSVEKFDRDEKGELDLWSKSRAKELAKVNSKLQRNDLRNSLMNSYNRRGWGLNDSFGVWAFDRFSGQYCFVPFGYGWGSPYGYYYGRDLWYFRLPQQVYIYNPSQNPGNTNTTGSTNPGTPRTNTNVERRERNRTPPFERVSPGVRRQSDPMPSMPTMPSIDMPQPTRTVTPASVPTTRGASRKTSGDDN